MKTTEILERLQNANYLPEQAKAIAEILEGHKEEQITREYLDTSLKGLKVEVDNQFEKVYGKFEYVEAKFDLQRSERQRDITQAKFDLVKWIVAGIFINGAVVALLKYIG